MTVGGSHAWIRSDPGTDVHVFVGLFEPVEQPIPAAMEAALEAGQAVALPPLPAPFAWHLHVQAAGPTSVEICDDGS